MKSYKVKVLYFIDLFNDCNITSMSYVINAKTLKEAKQKAIEREKKNNLVVKKITLRAL